MQSSPSDATATLELSSQRKRDLLAHFETNVDELDRWREFNAAYHADDRKFFYAANFEFSYNSRHWDERTYTSEIRPIIGWHLHPVDIIFNPILDNSFAGGFKSLDFAPATRVAYNLNPKTAVAIEEYADFGPLRNFYSATDQFHQIYGVFDRSTRFGDFEAGVGIGVTAASDKWTLKLLWSKDLNSKPNQ